jgi:hypothetical protein
MGLWPAADPSKVMENASVRQPLSMETLPFPLSSRAQPRDLRFYGPFMEMFSKLKIGKYRGLVAPCN